MLKDVKLKIEGHVWVQVQVDEDNEVSEDVLDYFDQGDITIDDWDVTDVDDVEDDDE
jgi:hypothetical protein